MRSIENAEVARLHTESPLTADVVTVVPTFCRPEHLVKAVTSALAQTFSGHAVIVIDDGGCACSPVERSAIDRDGAGHDLRYAIDATRLRTELGWEPTYPDFDAGLADTVRWYADHEQWWGPVKDGVESAYAARGQ